MKGDAELTRRPQRRFSIASDVTRALLASAAAIVVLTVVIVALPGMLPGVRTVSGFVTFMVTFVVAMFTTYVALTLAAFSRLKSETLNAVILETEARRNPRLERWLLLDQLSWILTAAGFALILVALTVMDDSLRRDPWALLGAALLVILSWAVMTVAASVHFMRLDVRRDALRFPDEAPRTFSDYFYVAAMVNTTFATSDVAVTSTRSRRAFTVMSISAMTFNTVVIALLVSGVITLAAN